MFWSNPEGDNDMETGQRDVFVPRITFNVIPAIRKPKWSPVPSLGIATFRIKKHNLVECTYKNKNGDRNYPNRFAFSQEQALNSNYRMGYAGDYEVIYIPIADLMTEDEYVENTEW